MVCVGITNQVTIIWEATRTKESNVKIRYYQKIDGWRWLGFLLAMIGAFILSNADVTTQWLGWGIASISCSIWIYMGIKDRDIPRALMEFMYLLLALRAIWNWLT